MVNRLVAVSLAIALAAALGAARANAQVTTSTGEYITPHVVDIAFSFRIGDKVLPAGRYDIEQPTRELLIFRSANGKVAVEAPVITRLSQANPVTEPKVVFDEVGNQFYLAEVLFPGKDGFVMAGTKEQHTHKVVKAEKKKA